MNDLIHLIAIKSSQSNSPNGHLAITNACHTCDVVKKCFTLPHDIRAAWGMPWGEEEFGTHDMSGRPQTM